MHGSQIVSCICSQIMHGCVCTQAYTVMIPLKISSIASTATKGKEMIQTQLRQPKKIRIYFFKNWLVVALTIDIMLMINQGRSWCKWKKWGQKIWYFRKYFQFCKSVTWWCPVLKEYPLIEVDRMDYFKYLFLSTPTYAIFQRKMLRLYFDLTLHWIWHIP